ncbi:MAG: hypothetical protein WCF91_02860 [bacterium]
MSENRREQGPAPESRLVSRAEFNELKDRFDSLEQMFQEVKTERDNLISAIAQAAVNNFDANSRAQLLSVAGIDPTVITNAQNAGNQAPVNANEQPTVVLRSRSDAPNYGPNSPRPFSAPPVGTAENIYFTPERIDRAQAIIDARNRVNAQATPGNNPNSARTVRINPDTTPQATTPRSPMPPHNGGGGPRGPRNPNVRGGNGGRGNGEYGEINQKRTFRNRVAAGLAVVALAGAGVWALFAGGSGKDSKADTNPNARPNVPTMTANANTRSANPTLSAALGERLNNSISVGEATKAINSNEGNIKHNVAAIFNSNEHITLDHNNGAMSSVLDTYAPGQIDAINGAEVVALSVQSSDSYAAGLYNAMNGRHVEAPLPNGVSPEQARQFIKQVMTDPNTKFSIQTPTGAFENHGMRGDQRYSAGTIHANGNVTMFVITDAHGNNAYIKTSNECFNVLNKLVGRNMQTSFGTVHIPTPTASNPNPKPQFHPGPKYDPNNTPAGVPGEPRGSGGNGPEHTRPQAGNAPSSVHQPQTPKPNHVPNSGGSSAPAETGVDNGTNGPATPGNGTGNPAGQINHNTTPSGD